MADVDIVSGYLFDKQELNRKITINSVYDRFDETGRIGAFNFDYDEKTSDPAKKPHVYWDSDVAKWMEGAAYIIKKHPTPELEAKVDALVEKIKLHQCDDGYFNIYYTVVKPEERFKHRGDHELYCAGHLMEAAMAYAYATGKRDFLNCMERYADCIYRAFVTEKSAAFAAPGHEEIELALIKMYLFTGKKKYLDLATYFIDIRGTGEDNMGLDTCDQSHLPVREQEEAVGHSVRAMYLYTGMAMLAAQTGERELISACKRLWEDTVLRKMYVTGGIGSTYISEAFTTAFDLPNDQAYTETCAGIGLMFFSQAMLALENNAAYADAIERVLYNGVLSGLSLDGRSFFYENPLEINLSDRFENAMGRRRFPGTQRLECFACSCCPPNINRLLSSLERYIYGAEDDTLFVNQFVSSTLNADGVTCMQDTTYPCGNTVRLTVKGVKRIAVRIPEWCDTFKLNKAYSMSGGYAVVDNDGEEIILELDMRPRAVFADCRVKNDAGRICVMRGPVVYCAEAVDNGAHLHSFVLNTQINAKEIFDEGLGLYRLEIPCKKRTACDGGLYSNRPPKTEDAVLKLIPYNCFANRGESDMLVWFCGAYS